MLASGIEEQERDHHRGEASVGGDVVAGIFGEVGPERHAEEQRQQDRQDDAGRDLGRRCGAPPGATCGR